jgi:capsular exopolysaccharide synthesis family protein
MRPKRIGNGRAVLEDKQSNILGDLIFKYLPYWPVFLTLFLIAGIGSWLYLKYATPLYEANARVMIKDERKGAEESKTLESLNTLSSKKIIENEMEVIQSRTLIDEVVKSLGLYASVHKESGIKKTLAYKTSPLQIRLQSPDKLVATTDKVYFTFDDKAGKVTIDNKQYSVNEWVTTPFGVLRFTPTKATTAPGEKFYFTLSSPKDVATGIKNALKVTTTSKQSSILNLNLKDESPERSEDILNELVVAYNKAIIVDKNTLAGNTLSFVEERLKSVEHDLDSIERKIQNYRSKTGSIDIGTQGRLFLENVSSNDQRLGEINMQLAVLGQVDAYVQNKNAGIVPSTLGVTDPTLSTLVNKLYNAELELETLKSTTGENNTLLVSVRDQIAKIRPSIIENVQNQRRSLTASRNNLSATNGAYSSALQGIPKKERDLIEINREHEILNGIYSFLLQKREETALSHASTVPDSRIIDKAQSTGIPVSPKSKIIYLAAFLFALFAGMGSIMAKESMSRKIMFRHEIEKLTVQPIIGEISAEAEKDPIVIGNDKKTFIAEQFRKLRTTLGFIGINSKHKRILVTSSISGEGKSFIASNLALTLALTGKKVVLLDFDLNNPSLNNKLNINEHKGITDYLLGESDLEDITLETDLDDNLFLIPTGQLPRNPSELIMSDKVEELLNRLNSLYDYIVIDTAPVGPVTDAYILSPFCDATLYVIRHKYTPKVFVERIDEENKINHLKNVSIVFNGVKSRGFSSKEYGYGYGYGYVYNNQQDRDLKKLRR